MPCRSRNKEMGKEAAAALVTVPLAMVVTMVVMVEVNLFHREIVVEEVVWTQNSKTVVVVDG